MKESHSSTNKSAEAREAEVRGILQRLLQLVTHSLASTLYEQQQSKSAASPKVKASKSPHGKQ